MPSREELVSIVERNEPTVFRGAALNWTMREVPIMLFDSATDVLKGRHCASHTFLVLRY